ncbi:MAG: hypothetical protein K9I26_00910 [Flavobacterium sp.]|nr:hypothetical protein [Flavobacterium sp.]
MKKPFLLIAFILLSIITSKAQENKIETKGIYKEIDVEKSNKIVEILNSGNITLKTQIVDSIIKKPNNYNPTVLYALSKELYSNNKKDEASYWFYLAQLRARYDANLCLDDSAKQAVAILNNAYGPNINKYAFENIDFLEVTVKKVVDFTKINEENYDHRWLNLHGMDAVLANMDEKSEKKELSKPKNEWEKIKQKTIEDYYNGFTDYLKSLKK